MEKESKGTEYVRQRERETKGKEVEEEKSSQVIESKHERMKRNCRSEEEKRKKVKRN